jgi:hypothetical protein
MITFFVKTKEELESILKFSEYIRSLGYQKLVPLIIGDDGVRGPMVTELFNNEVKVLPLFKLMIREEFEGYPVCDGDTIKFLLPDWVRSKVVFIDGIDRASCDLLVSLARVIHERRIHEYNLSNMIILGARPFLLKYLNNPEDHVIGELVQHCIVIHIQKEIQEETE